MMARDDFEHRLGQGLKRWAAAGEPTLDLEAYVQAQAAVPLPRRPRRWRRWLGGAAAAAILALALGATFPSWAGAAAGWPLVGPVIKEIIMKDAGLQWAYRQGLIQQPLAEARVGDVTIRILGVVADPVRTTIMYQMTGLSQPPAAPPVRADQPGLLGSLTRPAESYPYLQVRRLPGVESIFTSYNAPVWTPIGLLGTIGTNPLGADSGTVELSTQINGQPVALAFTVSRAEAARFSREVPVGRSQTVAGITVAVDSVVYTPVEILVKYRVDKANFSGGYSWDGTRFTEYVAGPAGRQYATGSHGAGGGIEQSFPATPGPLRLVIPVQVQGQPADLLWRLAPGSTARTNGVTVALNAWERQGDHLGLALHFAQDAGLVSVAGFEAVDAGGQSAPLKPAASGWSNHDGQVHLTLDATLPVGFEPVAVRAREVAVRVDGPWTFDLPASDLPAK